MLRELLFNLENAIVFQCDQNQQVYVRSIIENDTVFITILDNGVGIDDRMRKEIFKMFVKGSEKSVGLGLGLYITKKATEKLSGLVELKKSSDTGTEFEIRLPIHLRKHASGKISFSTS